MKSILNFLILSLLLSSHACKEDRDEISPSIIITEPSDGLLIEMPDTIAVTARVEDNEKLDFVNFGLVDQNLNSVGQRISVGDLSNPETFSLTLEVTDLDIENGTHFLEVFASDGNNDEREFVEVEVIAVPKIFLGIVYTDNDNPGLRVLYEDGSQEALYTASVTSLDFSMSSRLNSVTFYDRDLNRLRSKAIELNDLIWEVPDLLNGSESLVEIRNDKYSRSSRILTDGNRVMNFNKSGTRSGDIMLNPEWEPITFYIDEADLWVASETPSGFRVSKLFKSTGFELDHFVLPERPTRLARLNEEEIIVLDELGDLYILDSFNGGQFNIPTEDTGEIVDLVVTDGTAYFATESSLYKYSSGGFQAPIVYSSSGINGMGFDDVNQRLIIAEGGSLQFFLLNPIQNVGTIAVGADIGGLQALFNK